MTNYCQDVGKPCTLCCRIMGVVEIRKPRMQWCEHCNIGKGCRIYDYRPVSCNEFQCIAKQMYDEGQDVSPDLKPSVCGAVMHCTKDGAHVVVDLNDGTDWRTGRLGKFIHDLSKNSSVLIRARSRLIVVKDNTVLADYVDERLMHGKGQVDIEIPDDPTTNVGSNHSPAAGAAVRAVLRSRLQP